MRRRLGVARAPPERRPRATSPAPGRCRYPGGASVDVAALAAGPLAESAAANAGHRPRLRAALESGEAALLVVEQLRARGGSAMAMEGGGIFEFVEARCAACPTRLAYPLGCADPMA